MKYIWKSHLRNVSHFIQASHWGHDKMAAILQTFSQAQWVNLAAVWKQDSPKFYFLYPPNSAVPVQINTL